MKKFTSMERIEVACENYKSSCIFNIEEEDVIEEVVEEEEEVENEEEIFYFFK